MYRINKVAQTSKSLAVILGILSFVGTFMVIKEISIVVLGYFVGEFIFYLLVYAIGEIIEKLSEISDSNAAIANQLRDMNQKD